jgi:hypothetical protein
MSEDAVVRSYKQTNNQTYCKFTVALLDTANSGQFIPPAGANGGPVAGIATNSILASGQNDYIGGVFQTALTGAAWPVGASGSGTGRVLNVGAVGFFRGIFNGTGTVAPGDRLVVADTSGRVASVEADGLAYAGGTTAFLVGRADAPATVAGQLFRINVRPDTVKL